MMLETTFEMLFEDEIKIDKKMRKASSSPKPLKWALIGLLACVFAGIVAYYCFRVLDYTVSLAGAEEKSLLPVLLLALLHVACFAIAACTVRALADAALSSQSVSRRQSLRIVAISALLGVCALLEAALLLAISVNSGSVSAAMGPEALNCIADLTIAFVLAIGAVMYLCFSYIMSYCAFLQWFYDEVA